MLEKIASAPRLPEAVRTEARQVITWLARDAVGAGMTADAEDALRRLAKVRGTAETGRAKP